MMKTYQERVVSQLSSIRQTGQTFSCVGVMLQNKTAKMVVADFRQKELLGKMFPDSASRIITVDGLSTDKLRGWEGVLVWDNLAVVELFTRGVEAGSAAITGIESTARQSEGSALTEVLDKIAKIYNVNIMILPNPERK